MPAAVPEPTRQLASNVKRAMVEKELTAPEVAKRAKLSLNHLNLILRGRRMVQLDTLIKLAGALEVEVPKLVEGIAWEPTVTESGRFDVVEPTL